MIYAISIPPKAAWSEIPSSQMSNFLRTCYSIIYRLVSSVATKASNFLVYTKPSFNPMRLRFIKETLTFDSIIMSRCNLNIDSYIDKRLISCFSIYVCLYFTCLSSIYILLNNSYTRPWTKISENRFKFSYFNTLPFWEMGDSQITVPLYGQMVSSSYMSMHDVTFPKLYFHKHAWMTEQ
jgi:hypothetical protein